MDEARMSSWLSCDSTPRGKGIGKAKGLQDDSRKVKAVDDQKPEPSDHNPVPPRGLGRGGQYRESR